MDIEAAMTRIPPHSIEAEQAVLGAMLMNKDAVMVASEILIGEDFYQTAYGILFDAVVELFKEGKPVDLITLQEHLKEKNVPPEVSSMEYARELLAGVTTSANIKYYAEIVKEKAILRKLDFGREQFEKGMENFSGGQKKKVLIARSLCEQAHLYVWDEPLNFIDIYSRMQIERLILEMRPTLLLVEHDRAFRDAAAGKTVRMEPAAK